MVTAPATTPQKKNRRRWRPPSLRKAFHPDQLDGINQQVADIAADLERRIMAYAAEQGINHKSKRPAVTSYLRKLVARAVGAMTKKGKQVEEDARALGRRTAAEHLATLDPEKVAKAAANAPKMPRNPDLGTTVRTPKGLVESLQQVAPQALGSGMRLYDDVVRAVAATPPESDAARRRIAQKTIDDFAKRGITGITDKAGKRWNIVTYVEMATRTAAANLAMEAHIKEVLAAGLDVVRVTVMPNCHPWCQPYQGRLLSITGTTTGEYDGEKVVASLPEAVANGFRHPNCRHSVQVHVPGTDAIDPDTINPGDYAATQELRRLERQVRAARRAEAAAVSPQARTAAGRDVRRWQAAIREHVAETGVPRNRWREQEGNAR